MPDAVPDGIPAAEAMARLKMGRSAFYARIRELGITPIKDGNRSYLSESQLEQMRSYSAAAAIARRPAAAILAMAAGAADQAESVRPDSAESEQTDRERLEVLQLRLAILREAMDLGGPLTTAEVTLLLGARPGGNEVARGRILAVRAGRDCWILEPTD